jgi:hypothetical protein
MTSLPIAAIVLSTQPRQPGGTMDTQIFDDQHAANAPDAQLLIHARRVEQLRRLGLPPALGERFAGLVDWHEVAALVGRGCPPELALEIAR